jgi:hypothetical protein
MAIIWKTDKASFGHEHTRNQSQAKSKAHVSEGVEKAKTAVNGKKYVTPPLLYIAGVKTALRIRDTGFNWSAIIKGQAGLHSKAA